VRINLEGRERRGRVPLRDYDEECRRVERLLRACVHPHTGKPVVGAVTRMRDDDPVAREGPGADLVVECEGPADSLRHPDFGTIGPFPFPRVGAHTADGFAWISGREISPGRLGTRPAIDLPATVLGLLGLPPDVTGCVGRPMLPVLHHEPPHGATAARNTASHAEAPRA
jgi:hypothetical protein